ncbi:Ankyrin repeat-containing-like protein [Melia azedarach]|uniref:Ankyrin repeat-containing-like protein n=1 Tax=Melia azedarach TaxID=155640 RepID=A0ACC1Y1S4_MELAZ|nr:Ankyrin repeat-containing-like protein [Melia azedarach]
MKERLLFMLLLPVVNFVIMQELIHSCPGCWELVDSKGCNVFHFALDSKNESAVQLLLDNPSLGNLINEKNNQGNTPLLQLATSGYHMKSFVCHPEVDKLVFDCQNRNAADIILCNYDISSEQLSFLRNFLSIKGKISWRHIALGDDDKREKVNVVNYKNKDEKDEEKSRDEVIEEYIKNSKESHLVVAALIATVTFTAGITLPGGYINEKGTDQGTSVLVSTGSKAFQAFVILNTIAMTFSSCAVFIHLFVSLMKHKNTGFVLWRLGLIFITYAMVAMVLAFLTGMYAVLYRARELAISVCAISGLFLFVFICFDPCTDLGIMMTIWKQMVFIIRRKLRAEFSGIFLRRRIMDGEQHSFCTKEALKGDISFFLFLC